MKHYPYLYHDRARATPVRRGGRVAILLALFEGERFLAEQLDSIARQSHRDWSLSVRDDGSRDGGPAMVRAFAGARPGRDIRLWGGAHRGSARNFLALIEAADPEADYIAYADQDDVWAPGKLERATRVLGALPPGIPALYCGRTSVTDAALRPRGRSPQFRRAPGFRNALVQSIAGGNTMVANRGAADILRIAAAYRGAVPAHDWWSYQVVTGCGGTVIYDPDPMVLYRQHGRNMVGANRGATARLKRLAALAGGQLARWSDQNIAALSAISPMLTKGNRDILRGFAELRGLPVATRMRRLAELRLHRQTGAGQAALLAAAAFGRV